MTFPLVMITWLDATDIETGWHTLQEIKNKELLAVESVGWLVEETDEKMTLMVDVRLSYMYAFGVITSTGCILVR